MQLDVRPRVEEHAVAGQAVAAGAADLLVLGLSTSFGMSRWITKRTFDLSMPMPNAMVATTTSTSSRWNASWLRVRSSSSRPAW